MLGNGITQVTSFLSWWAGELRSITPASWRDTQFRDSMVIEASHDANFVLKSPTDDIVASGEVGAIINALHSMAAPLSPIILRLPESAVLIREFFAPVSSLANLQRMAAFDLEVETPFSCDEVVFDLDIRERDHVNGALCIRQVIASNDVINESLFELRNAGLKIDKIDVVGIQGINLLPHDIKAKPNAHLWAGAALGLAALSLVFVSVHIRQQNIIHALTIQAEDLEDSTGTVRQAAQAARTGLGTALLLDEMINSEPAVITLLAEITDILDDDVWLDRLAIKGKEVIISGYALSAASLITSLEASESFEKVTIRAPITPDPSGTNERFELQFYFTNAQRTEASLNEEATL